ncbi:MAG: ABC transporter ATP-binding protein [Alphaproteobacteria bacterium]|nr:MAG: ABC transporter ATP-binding protein [Alphaproteobacteria bacterium]
MLQVSDLCVQYGRQTIVRNLSFSVAEGEVVTLIGANGAGKTTTLRTVSGLKRRSSGTIIFQGAPLRNQRAHVVARMGIAHVPEGRHVFPEMTVVENLELGAYRHKDSKLARSAMDEVFDWFPRLRERAAQAAGTMSGGEQQMLAIGRALMSSPKLLLLDEPSLGLAPTICAEIAKIIKGLKESGRTIVLVEQNARMALNLADRAYVIERGHVAMEGDAREMASNPDIKKAYLGIA